MKTRQIINRASKTAAVAVMACCLGMTARATMWQMDNIAALQAQLVGTLTDGDTATVLGYYSESDGGGGLFKWHATSTSAPDGGQYISPNGNPAQGRWSRVLRGEIPTVKMWGAKGDKVKDDTIAIQSAVNALGVGELYFPTGQYLITNTITFFSCLHLRGASPWNSTMIWMQGNHDIFMTLNASNYLAVGYNPIWQNGWEHGLLIENFSLYCDTNSTTAAGIVLCNPGEASTIRNVHTANGGYGIRCFGIGAPGLQVAYFETASAAVAAIGIEGYLPSGQFVGGGVGPVSIISPSADYPCDPTSSASFVRIHDCNPSVSIHDLKAEGWFRNGLVNYEKSFNSTNSYWDQEGSVTIEGGTWNGICGGNDSDFVVLNSVGGSRATAAVTIHAVNMWSVRHLIRDDLTGRTIEPFQAIGLLQRQADVPLHYQGSNPWPDKTSHYPPRTRLVMGGDARCDFVPTVPGWYRVMYNLVFHMGGALDIYSYTENSEVQVDVSPSTSGAKGAWINVSRPTVDNGWGYQPLVTQVRAGGYEDPVMGNNMAFLDIYVARTDTNNPITLKHPLTSEFGDDGVTELCVPFLVSTNLIPPGCTLHSCVTNSLLR